MADSTHDSTTPHLAAIAGDLYHCATCNYCVEQTWPERGISHVCATLEHHDASPAYSGRGYIEIARAWLEGADLPLSSLAQHAFTCTDCGNCERVCPIGLHPAAAARALRAELVDRDAAPAAAAARVARALGRDATAGAVALETISANTAYLPLPSCHAADAEDDAMWAVVQTTDAGAVRAGPSACCGEEARVLGFVAHADAARAACGSALAATTVTEIVAGFGACLGTFVAVAHERGAAAQVTDFCAWAANAVAAGRLVAAPRGALPTIALVESCRADNDALRRLLLALGVVFPDAFPNAHALCCGGGGVMRELQGEAADRMAQARLGPDRQATVIVSVDPRCREQFRNVTGSNQQVVGPAEFLQTWFSLERAP